MTDGFDIGADALKKAQWLFAQECAFVAGAATADRLPDSSLPEIAFVGRSNVGKSSLINALTGRKTLARASNTPGRTQQINFFDLGGQMTLVDLPGYGYAKASKEKIHDWNMLVTGYLSGRSALARVLVLVDSRHGLLEADAQALDFLDQHRAAYIIVLTKTDKTKQEDCKILIGQIEKSLRDRKGAFPKVYATSADKGYGISELRGVIARAAMCI